MLTTVRAFVPASCPGGSGNAPGRVPDELMGSLRAHGMHCPIRGINDPRLEHPELLLIAGWERVDVDDGYGYRMTVQEDKKTNDCWEQYFEVRNDTSKLVTRAGHAVQTLTEDPQGRVSASMQLVP